MKSEQEIKHRLEIMEQNLVWNKTMSDPNSCIILVQEREIRILKWVLEDGKVKK